jgi:hypothetical protein
LRWVAFCVDADVLRFALHDDDPQEDVAVVGVAVVAVEVVVVDAAEVSPVDVETWLDC